MKFLLPLLLILMSACASREVKIPLPPQALQGSRTPQLLLPEDADQDMKSAALVFRAYANSDEFYKYVEQNVTKLEGGNENNLQLAISKYRGCLQSHGPVPIVYQDYPGMERTRVIGGWRKNVMAQNRYKELNAIDRAAHWVHELTHACGFTHYENDIVLHPIIKKSWSYQVGNAFKSFIEAKAL